MGNKIILRKRKVVMLLTLWIQAPIKVLLSGITCANRTRGSLIQKRREVFFSDKRMERCERPQSTRFSRKATGRAAQSGSLPWRAGWAPAGPAQAHCSLHLTLKGGTTSLHTARRRHLGLSVLGTVCARPAKLRCQAQPLAVGTLSEVPGAKRLLEAPFDQVTPD